MKTQIHLLLACLVTLFFVSCQEEPTDEEIGTGTLSIGFNSVPNDAGRIAESPSAIFITIKDASGEFVYEFEKLELLNIRPAGSEYISKTLEFKAGTYTIEEFVVVDESGNAIYIAPKEGSELANLVDHPLPQQFRIQAEAQNNVTVQVLETSEGSANDFGYATFSFDVVTPRTDDEISIVSFNVHVDSVTMDPGTYGLEDGKLYKFEVMVEYNLQSVDKGVLMIGFNNGDDPNSFIMHSDVEEYIEKGDGPHNFVVITKAKYWENKRFKVYVNLSDAEHGTSWTPLASDYEGIAVKPSYNPNEPQDLVGSWDFMWFIDHSNGDTLMLPEGFNAHISFGDEGCFAVKAPCNSGGGKYELKHSGSFNYLIVKELGLTEMACSPVQDLEMRFVNGLTGQYSASSGHLTINPISLSTGTSDPAFPFMPSYTLEFRKLDEDLDVHCD